MSNVVMPPHPPNASQPGSSSSQTKTSTDPSAIKQAWLNHTDKDKGQLDDWEQNLFKQYNVESLESFHAQLLKDVNKENFKSQTVKAARVLQPFVAALEMYVPLVNSVSWSSPVPVASCILGGIQCLAQVPMHFLEMQDSILEDLKGISLEIPRLLKYEDQIFKDKSEANKEVKDILLGIFGTFFTYLRKVARLFYDKEGKPKARKMIKKSFFSDYKLQLGDIKQEIVANIERFERTAELAIRLRTDNFQHKALIILERLDPASYGQRANSMEDFHSTVDGESSQHVTRTSRRQDQTLTDQKRAIIYESWIPSIDFTAKHKQNSRRLAGTGEWLYRDHQFVKWRQSDDPDPILTIQGKAGSGKSFLAAAVVNELQAMYKAESWQTPVVKIYCGAMRRFQANRSWLFGSILRQLLSQMKGNSIERELEQAYDQCGQKHPSEERLEELVELAISKFKKIFLVIDGLEECQRLEAEDFERVCSSLQSLARSSTIPLRLIVFRGPNYKLFERHFGSRPYIIIDDGANDDDMKQYIRKNLFEAEPDVYNRRPVLRDEVEQALLEKADGVFLWLSRMIPILRDCDSAPEIREAMESLPKDMGQYYKDTLLRIAAGTKRTVRFRSMKMLVAVCNAKRLLTSAEMSELLAVERGASDVDEDALIVSKSALTSGCHDLVVLQDGVYEPIHKSLKDWIRQIGQSPSHELRELQALQEQAQKDLAIICLTYLRFEKFRRQPLQSEQELRLFLDENPFFGYAATYWGKHVAQAVNFDAEDEDMVHDMLECNELRNLCLQVLVFNGQTEIEMSWRAPNSSALHLLANFNLVSCAQRYATATMIYQVDGFGALPLDYALANRHKEISIWMLKKATDADVGCSDLAQLFPPLHTAASLDWPDVIELLLSLGLDADCRDPNTMATALHHASHDGSQQACSSLLSANASLEARDVFDQTPLLVAAWARQTPILGVLLDAGADVDASGWQDCTALHHVAMNGDVSAARKLIQFSASKDCRTRDSQTPLHLAARYDHVEVLRQLTQPDDDTEAKDVTNKTALLWAAQSGSVKAVKHLIARKALLNHKDSHGFTALHYAAAMGYTAVIKALCIANADLIHVVNDDDKTPFVTAIDADHSEAALQLLDLGSSVGPYGEQQDRPLHRAIEHAMQDVVKAIIRKHPEEAVARGIRDFTALHYAARHGLEDIAEELVVVGNADLNALNCNKRSISWIAAKHNRATFLAKLLRLQDMATPAQRVDFSVSDKDQGTPLHAAALAGATESLQFLLGQGVIATRDVDANTPLYHAASSGNVDCVKLLMPKADSDKTHLIQTALFKAASNSHLSIVEFLLKSGADPNYYEQCHSSHEYFGKGTLFQLAVSSGNLELVRLLVGNKQKNANLNDICGPTWLCDVARNGNTDLLELLLGAEDPQNLNEKFLNGNGEQAMYLAAKNGHPAMVQVLGKLGCDVNRANSTSQRPIHAAIADGHYQTAEALLNLGAEIDARDASGSTALSYAAKSYRFKCFQLLLERGADPSIKDKSGYSAWDHISEDPQFWSNFSFVPQDQLSKAEIQRLRDLWSAAVEEIRSVLLLASPPCTKVLNERCFHILSIIKDLMQMADEDDEDEDESRIAQRPAKKRRGSHVQFINYQCPVCLRHIEYEGKFVCMSCSEDTSMCRECHIECSELGSKHIVRVPRAREIWERLEKDIHRIRKIVAENSDFRVENLAKAFFEYFKPVLAWFEAAFQSYQSWLQEFGSTARWKKLPTPGLEFLELIQAARDTFVDDESLDSDSSSDHFDSAEAINNELLQHFERYPIEIEVEVFQCEGHEYIEFSRFLSINRQPTFDYSKHLDQVSSDDVDQLMAKALITSKDSKSHEVDASPADPSTENRLSDHDRPRTPRWDFPSKRVQRSTARREPDIETEWVRLNPSTSRSTTTINAESFSSSGSECGENDRIVQVSIASTSSQRVPGPRPRQPRRAYTLYDDEFPNFESNNMTNQTASASMHKMRNQARNITYRKLSMDRQLYERADGPSARDIATEKQELEAKCASLAFDLYQMIECDKVMTSLMDDNETVEEFVSLSRQNANRTNGESPIRNERSND